MKQRVYWIGVVLVFLIEFFVMITAHLTIKNVTLFCFGGLWIWRAIAVGFLKVKGVYNLKLTRKREIILAVIDGALGLSWMAIALLAGAKQIQISLILLCAIPAIIAVAAVSYYKNEQDDKE